MNQSIEKKRGKRNKTKLYYDVTNYYFEIENEDDFRMRGVSKEHRPNPIVQMGIMLDTEGIPLDYEIFPGNHNDMTIINHGTSFFAKLNILHFAPKYKL